MEQRAAIKFCVNLKKTATETFEMLKNAYEIRNIYKFIRNISSTLNLTTWRWREQLVLCFQNKRKLTSRDGIPAYVLVHYKRGHSGRRSSS
jgi:hypothetical protein